MPAHIPLSTNVAPARATSAARNYRPATPLLPTASVPLFEWAKAG